MKATDDGYPSIILGYEVGPYVVMMGSLESHADVRGMFPTLDDAPEYHACPDSTIARPNNVITNQVSFKSEAKPRYDENQDSNYRPHCKSHGELAPSI